MKNRQKKVRGLIVRGFRNKLPVTIDCIEKKDGDVEVYLNGNKKNLNLEEILFKTVNFQKQKKF